MCSCIPHLPAGSMPSSMTLQSLAIKSKQRDDRKYVRTDGRASGEMRLHWRAQLQAARGSPGLGRSGRNHQSLNPQADDGRRQLKLHHLPTTIALTTAQDTHTQLGYFCSQADIPSTTGRSRASLLAYISNKAATRHVVNLFMLINVVNK